MGYATYAVKRLFSAIFILFGASIVIFAILRLTPGDPARVMMGWEAPVSAVEQARIRMGLHLPMHEQYIHWISDILLLEMGDSHRTGNSIEELLRMRYPRSALLAVASVAIATLIAIPLGILASLKQNSRLDYGTLLFSQFGISLPGFVFAIGAIFFVGGGVFNWFPSSGYVSPMDDPVDSLRHIALPAITLGFVNAAVIVRFVRSEMLEEQGKDYVRTAKAYGFSRRDIITNKVLKNAMIPTLTIVGLQIGGLIGGLVIIEQVFSYPGMGTLVLNALYSRDFPVIQATLLVIAATYIMVNLVVDLLYGFLDPKIKY